MISFIVSCRSSFLYFISWKNDVLFWGFTLRFDEKQASCFFSVIHKFLLYKSLVGTMGLKSGKIKNCIKRYRFLILTAFWLLCQISSLLKLLLKYWICIPILQNRFNSCLHSWSPVYENEDTFLLFAVVRFFKTSIILSNTKERNFLFCFFLGYLVAGVFSLFV